MCDTHFAGWRSPQHRVEARGLSWTMDMTAISNPMVQCLTTLARTLRVSEIAPPPSTTITTTTNTITITITTTWCPSYCCSYYCCSSYCLSLYEFSPHSMFRLSGRVFYRLELLLCSMHHMEITNVKISVYFYQADEDLII